jgi:hypothetical protein
MPSTNPEPSANLYRVTYNELDCYHEVISPTDEILLRFPDEGEAQEALEMIRQKVAERDHPADG